MKSINIKSIEYILRVVVFLTFFGHGYLALIGNVSWLVYLETVGFSIENGMKIMPVIGALDILIAMVVLFKPYKYIVIWMIFWAFSTALVRPLSGEPIWSFIERGANWGAPLALLFILKLKTSLSES